MEAGEWVLWAIVVDIVDYGHRDGGLWEGCISRLAGGLSSSISDGSVWSFQWFRQGLSVCARPGREQGGVEGALALMKFNMQDRYCHAEPFASPSLCSRAEGSRVNSAKHLAAHREILRYAQDDK